MGIPIIKWKRKKIVKLSYPLRRIISMDFHRDNDWNSYRENKTIITALKVMKIDTIKYKIFDLFND